MATDTRAPITAIRCLRLRRAIYFNVSSIRSSTRAVMAMLESTGSFTATSRRHRHADTLITTAGISRMYSLREYVSEKSIRGMSKERFNDTIKDALANRKAIGVSIGVVSSSGHIETIWGAEFDENGDVAYIYMSDNNDRDLFESDGIGCGRYQIVYGTYPEGGTYTGYLTGYIGSTKPVNIVGLTIIELGEEYWKRYFGL